MSWVYFLKELFFLQPGGSIIFVPEKNFIPFFFTNMRRPRFFLTEKAFFISLYLQTQSSTPYQKYFMSQAPIFYLRVRPILGPIGRVCEEKKITKYPHRRKIIRKKIFNPI